MASLSSLPEHYKNSYSRVPNRRHSRIFDDLSGNPVYLDIFFYKGVSDILLIVFIVEFARKGSHICVKR